MEVEFFQLISKDPGTSARRGRITTDRGAIESPFFMPVGTNGTVKSLTFEDLHEIGAQLMLSNTYHLSLRPGADVLMEAGGLHGFSGWNKPLLTDSGGYQVFSLTKLRKMSEDGVKFQSHLDGSEMYLNPEKVIDLQRAIGSDMVMPLDECSPYPCSVEAAAQAVDRSARWARRARDYFDGLSPLKHRQHLFGIIQGSVYEDLRRKALTGILEIGFEGYAIGGVSVGETVDEMFSVLDWIAEEMPEKSPRYFMGIGLPDQMVAAVGMGIDMFDTVLPTRFGRHGTAFTAEGRAILRNKEFVQDDKPIDPRCSCAVCRKYSRQYIRHLLKQNEITGLKLVTYHNLYFYIDMMKQIREAIDQGCYRSFAREFLTRYGSPLSARFMGGD